METRLLKLTFFRIRGSKGRAGSDISIEISQKTTFTKMRERYIYIAYYFAV